MFRNPRENIFTANQVTIKPSTGRPPTPPSSNPTTPRRILHQLPSITAGLGSMLPLTPKSNTTVNGNAGRGKASSALGGANGRARGKGMANGNILNFFKKADSGLFVGSSTENGNPISNTVRSPSPEDGLLGSQEDVDAFGDASNVLDGERFNEISGSVKKRRLHSSLCRSNDTQVSAPPTDRIISDMGGEAPIRDANTDEVAWAQSASNGSACSPPPPDFNDHMVEACGLKRMHSQDGLVGFRDSQGVSARVEKVNEILQRKVGPFVEDSDSEAEEGLLPMGSLNGRSELAGVMDLPDTAGTSKVLPLMIMSKQEDQEPLGAKVSAPAVPNLKKESTSMFEDDQFDNLEDFGDDEYIGGEEFEGRRWMEEEERWEMGEEGPDDENLGDPDHAVKQEMDRSATDPEKQNDALVTCPICNVSSAGVSDAELTVHVNNCLDGNSTPLPERKLPVRSDPVVTTAKPAFKPKFQQVPRPPKPGQENPFILGASKSASSSAFSKLMSTHAEDAAWANAAAAENASRGKPAYQRTCPFYKILPGLFICVDAFRYGAVEGCQAYFLSHFHSDHYIGLTSTWQHGPIYCSKVTANLVRQQLRVDSKWVVDLEFEQKAEIQGTQGVAVTMIPANHCPGSSLFLFEKVIGKGKTPKVQRILHCGDFRACPAHLQHPLLRPELIDAVNGKQIGQQRIDVCYLDTTYLNPKYAFPSQEDVIKACADMCVSLRKERADETDGWEQMKKERAGSGMVKFVRTSSNAIKEEDGDDETHEVIDDVGTTQTSNSTPGKSRGRLLVVVGTYSIGKERICMGIARALNSKIYAPPNKQRICACLEDAELNSRLTRNPHEAQVHMTPLVEIRAETLHEYLTTFKPHFSRVVGFRPSGWNYRPPNSRFVESPAVKTVLFSENWKSKYSMADLIPQRGSTREASCFGVPYSEHSSFRELSMFCCALRIEKIIPTVNIGSAKSREKMKGWCEKWAAERKKNGLFRLGEQGGIW